MHLSERYGCLQHFARICGFSILGEPQDDNQGKGGLSRAMGAGTVWYFSSFLKDSPTSANLAYSERGYVTEF